MSFASMNSSEVKSQELWGQSLDAVKASAGGSQTGLGPEERELMVRMSSELQVVKSRYFDQLADLVLRNSSSPSSDPWVVSLVRNQKSSWENQSLAFLNQNPFFEPEPNQSNLKILQAKAAHLYRKLTPAPKPTAWGSVLFFLTAALLVQLFRSNRNSTNSGLTPVFLDCLKSEIFLGEERESINRTGLVYDFKFQDWFTEQLSSIQLDKLILTTNDLLYLNTCAKESYDCGFISFSYFNYETNTSPQKDNNGHLQKYEGTVYKYKENYLLFFT